MEYICNIYLDNTARKVGGSGPNRNAYVAAHLWKKDTGKTKTGEWVPVADPLTVSMSSDTVGFKLRDIFGDLTDNAVYKITFIGAAGSPLEDPTTQQLANGTYDWIPGETKTEIPFVTTHAKLPLIKQGDKFEFSIEVVDKGSEVYYMDPRMIVDP